MTEKSLLSHPNPARTYSEAIEKYEAFKQQDIEGVDARCFSELMTHNQKVAQAIVFFHGYTNCPSQFHLLSEKFYQMGYNVLNARAPYHGLADRLTDEIARLTAKDLVAFTDRFVDVATGLGERVTMAGISMGGVLSAWAGQYRSDVDQAVIIAPSFGFKAIPKPLTKTFMKLATRLPNFFVWWDPRYKDKLEPTHAYPRYSTRALAQIMRLGFAVRNEARQSKPEAGRILSITNAADLAVSNPIFYELVEDWQNAGAQNIQTYEFPSSLGMYFHDIIDPGQSYQKVDEIYPVLIDLITTGEVQVSEPAS
jgi:carboxylesterase